MTIHSQQSRALNLVWALHESGAVSTTMAILGGGISGCTAAVAASRLGLEVLLLEQHSEVMTLQAGCTQRWVHPNLLDWPRGEPFGREARLPLMRWYSGTAGSVIDVLHAEFVRELEASHIELVTKSRNVRFGADGEVVYETDAGRGVRQVDAGVYAVGFGVESAHPGYWRDNDLEQHLGREEIVVSGAGDAALADVLRLRLGSAGRGGTFFEWLEDEGASVLGPFVLQVEQLERRLAVQLHRWDPHGDQSPKAADQFSEAAGREYGELWEKAPGEFATLRTEVGVRLRSDNNVVLVAPRRYDPRASALHRFLLALLGSSSSSERLVLDNRLDFRAGRRAAEGNYIVENSGTVARDLADRRWIVRHGPTSALERCAPTVNARVKSRAAAYGYAWPRRQLWPDDYFDGKTATTAPTTAHEGP